jgi:hypothetical protein
MYNWMPLALEETLRNGDTDLRNPITQSWSNATTLGNNSSSLLEQGWVMVGTGTEAMQWVVTDENPHYCNSASFTRNILVFKLHNISVN